MDELMPLHLDRDAASSTDAAPRTVRGLHSCLKLAFLKKKKEMRGKPGVIYESGLLKPTCANTVYPPHLLSSATYV